MNIEERVEIAILIKYYGKTLTDKQRNIIDMYVDNNLSLSEVSEELNISRQAVKDALDNAFLSLKQMEEKLQFVARDKKLKDLIENKQNTEISLVTKFELISYLEDF